MAAFTRHYPHWPPGVPKSLSVPRTSLHYNLEVSARRYPAKSALHYYGTDIAYAELARSVDALAGFLQRAFGVRRGDRVLLYTQNSPQFVIGYFAALKLGAIVVAFNPLYAPREIEHQLNDCEAKVMITLSLFYQNVAEVRAKTKLEQVIVAYNMLGDEIFLKAFQEYIIRCNGKHPTPYDFYFTFNEVTGENLNWFWTTWFFESGYPDLAIDKVVTNNGEAEISIRKVGNVPTPVILTVTYENETSEGFYFNAGIWKDGNEIFITKIKLADILKEIQLGDLVIPDSNRDNNLFLVH